MKIFVKVIMCSASVSTPVTMFVASIDLSSVSLNSLSVDSWSHFGDML